MEDPSKWQTFTAEDGRPYYFNEVTKETKWEKPQCLKSKYEQALDACQWKEYQTPEGKSYYYHKTTKATVWELPKELVELAELKAKEEAEEAEKKMAEAIAARNEQAKANRKLAPMLGRIPLDAPRPTNATDDFKRLLNDAGVPGHAVWDTALRAVVGDPRYSAINSLQEKKRIFKEYCVEQRARERRDYIARKQEAQDNFNKLLDSTPEIGLDKANTYRQALVLVGTADPWLDVEDEDERKFFFEEYIHGLEKKKKDEEEAIRLAKVKAVSQLFIALAYKEAELDEPTKEADAADQKENDAENDKNGKDAKDAKDAKDDSDSAPNRPTTRERELDALLALRVEETLAKPQPPIAVAFRDAVTLLEGNEQFAELTLSERVRAHEMAAAELERRLSAWRRATREAKRELARRRRVAFRQLLQEAVASGELHARTPWIVFREKKVDDERLKAMFDQAGSQAAELFDDVVDELTEEYEKYSSKLRKEIYSIIEPDNEAEEGETTNKEKTESPSIEVVPTDTFESFKEKLVSANQYEKLTAISENEQHIQFAIEDVIERCSSDAESDLKRLTRELWRESHSREGLLSNERMIKLFALLGTEKAMQLVLPIIDNTVNVFRSSRSVSPRRRRSISPRYSRKRSVSPLSDSGDERKRSKKHKKKSRSSSSKRKYSDEESLSDDDRRHKKRRSSSSRKHR